MQIRVVDRGNCDAQIGSPRQQSEVSRDGLMGPGTAAAAADLPLLSGGFGVGISWKAWRFPSERRVD
jgi:hypothetical protein